METLSMQIFLRDTARSLGDMTGDTQLIILIHLLSCELRLVLVLPTQKTNPSKNSLLFQRPDVMGLT
jgi:hypothetical protein